MAVCRVLSASYRPMLLKGIVVVANVFTVLVWRTSFIDLEGNRVFFFFGGGGGVRVQHKLSKSTLKIKAMFPWKLKDQTLVLTRFTISFEISHGSV